MVRAIIFVLALMTTSVSFGQFANVSLSQKKVYVEQPIKVKITVYSPTWFAEPLSIDNLQINGAFIQSFSQTRPGVTKINNQQYSTLEFYYILFPIKEGSLTFPELSIRTSIPPEGEYKGKPVTIKTKPAEIIVEPIPGSADQERWLVASNVTIRENWSSSLDNLQVGDVIKRSITIRANGTMPSFIDPPNIGEVDFATIYGGEPNFVDERDAQGTNGRRTDEYSYLMEETGEFTIPEVKVEWYNPYTNRNYSRSLAAREISIAENTSMAELNHLRDSLNALNQPLIAVEEEAAEVDYTEWVKIGLLVIVAIIVLSWLAKLAIMLRNRIADKRNKYLQSEAYAFKLVLKQESGDQLLSSTYHFIDTSEKRKTSTFRGNMAGNDELLAELEKIQKDIYSTESAGYEVSKIKRLLKNWHRQFSGITSRKHNVEDLPPINPR